VSETDTNCDDFCAITGNYGQRLKGGSTFRYDPSRSLGVWGHLKERSKRYGGNMNRFHRIVWFAGALWALGCGGGGGGTAGQDLGPLPDLEGLPDDLSGLDVPERPDLVRPDEVAAPDEGLADLSEAGPDPAEVAPCGEPCSVSNEFGTCSGWRACVDGGLAECDAATPAKEVCDGVDNDCDGQTDEDPEALCDDGNACTDDRCEGAAGCSHPVAPGRCLIGGICYLAGDHQPQNDCLFCLPDLSTDTWSERTGGCDDGNPCTTRDTCEQGVCVGKQNVCECSDDADCKPHEDGNACNGTLFCDRGKVPYTCEVDPATVVHCDASGDSRCLANQCNPQTGACSMTPVFEGEPCDDAQACTKDDRCVQGQCAGTAYSCDDLLPCTQDRCDGQGGCEYVLAPYYCVIGEPGAGAACVPHGEKNPANPCEICNAQTQASGWSAWSGPCDDADPCTAGDACGNHVCAGEPYTCDDGLDCTTEVCDGTGGCKVTEVAEGFCAIGGACVEAGTLSEENTCLWCAPALDPLGWSANDLPCEDGDPCTTGDRCADGVCVAGSRVSCDDENLCTDDRCDAAQGGCVHVDNTAPCDDGNPCTVGDRCENGACAPGELNACECEQDSDCPDDANLCNGSLVCNTSVYPHRCEVDPATVVTCDPSQDTTCRKNQCIPATGACEMVPVQDGLPCDDGDACTAQDRCGAGTCHGTAYSCEDGLDCTADACAGDGTCSHTVKAGFCLIAGACVPAGNEMAGNPCLVCDPDTAKTTWTPRPNGTPCNDGLVCTHSDACLAGQCRGTPYGCEDGLACTTDTCVGDGTCVHALLPGFCLIDGACREDGVAADACHVCDAEADPTHWTFRDSAPCDDGNACTHHDQCVAAGETCAGTPYDCDDGLSCTDDRCLGDGTCKHTLIANACLIDGACYGRGEENPENPCERCWPASSSTEWSSKPDGTACSDENECTINDKCVGGQCASGAARICDDQNPCTDDLCDPATGCVTRPNDVFFANFEEGAGGFTFENSDPVVGWSLVKNHPVFPSGILYYGAPDVWSYDTPESANSGTAWSDWLAIEGERPAYLSFDLYLDNEWSNRFRTGGGGRRDADNLQVVLQLIDAWGNPMEVQVWNSAWAWDWWVQTPQGMPLRPKYVRISEIDLKSSLQVYGSTRFRLGFRFQTQDASWNDFGGVVVDNIAIGSSCSDGDACKTGDSCEAGVCVGVPADCDDANDCTADSCDPQYGCRHEPVQVEQPCEDYDLCTEGTLCAPFSGWCGQGTPVVCPDDGNDCTSDACDPAMGCAYQPLPDFTECFSAEPYGSCVNGGCLSWSLEDYLAGDYHTAFLAVAPLEPDGRLAIAGRSDYWNMDPGDPVLPALFDDDTLEMTLPPWQTWYLHGDGEMRAIAGGLAAGYRAADRWGSSPLLPETAVWDFEQMSWNFDPAVNPVHVPAVREDRGIYAAAHAPNSDQYFLGGSGQVADIQAFIERCVRNPDGSWQPCEPMAALTDPWSGCRQIQGLTIYSMWAESDSGVWAAGTSMNDMGQPSYTILYYDGNGMTQCGDLSGFSGAFIKDWTYGMQSPAAGSATLYAIHGTDRGNLWAAGSEGKIYVLSQTWMGWQERNPSSDGIAWDESHTVYGVFVEPDEVHIVGAIGDWLPFYLHARRTSDFMNPWRFDRKVEFGEFAADRALFTGVARSAATGVLEAVGYAEYWDGSAVGIRARIGP